MKLTRRQLRKMIYESMAPMPKSTKDLRIDPRKPKGSFSNPLEDFFDDQFEKRNPEYMKLKNKFKTATAPITTNTIILHDGERVERQPNGIVRDALGDVVLVVVPKQDFEPDTLEKSTADYFNVDVDLGKKMKMTVEEWLELYAEHEDNHPYKIIEGGAALGRLDYTNLMTQSFPNRKKAELKRKLKDYLGLK